jgi:hypothetical protein
MTLFVMIVATLYFGREVLVPATPALLLVFILAPVVELLRRVHLGRVPSVLVGVYPSGRRGESLFKAVRLCPDGQTLMIFRGGHPRAGQFPRGASTHQCTVLLRRTGLLAAGSNTLKPASCLRPDPRQCHP